MSLTFSSLTAVLVMAVLGPMALMNGCFIYDGRNWNNDSDSADQEQLFEMVDHKVLLTQLHTVPEVDGIVFS